PAVGFFVSLLWTSGIVEEDPRESKAICCKGKCMKKDKREEFLRDWLEDVGAVCKQKSESEENEEELEADL
ncbi:Hypothetical predicted protein, partial [Paramuricea clavata]